MVLSAVPSLPHWLPLGETAPSGSTVTTLRTTVCQLSPLTTERRPLGQTPAVTAAVQRLVAVVMALRSPTGGWPTHLEQTPEHLEAYIGEEIWELLEAVKETAVETPTASSLVALPTLVSSLLWMLASSSYDTMHLIEGVRARVYDAEARFSVRLLRLVPLLRLTTDSTDQAWDLVTQTGALPDLYLPPETSLQLVDHDLDQQHLGLPALLAQVADQVRQTQPGLTDLLRAGQSVMALTPFHPWQTGRLTLRLHLADMGPVQGSASPTVSTATVSIGSSSGISSDLDPAPSSSFTLDDFADTFSDSSALVPPGVLGNWLTFTDESWVEAFLLSCAQGVMAQQVEAMARGHETADLSPEQVCAKQVYQATELAQGPNGLFKHTFVHAPVLVADLWPRLRWYLAQSSERVMQLMGGLAAQVLLPGRSWQRGNLYLRPVMQLITPHQKTFIDLGSGKPLLTQPLALPHETVIIVDDAKTWAAPLTVETLAELIHHDLTNHASALVALHLGTNINLHCLETEVGCQGGRLSLDWCFTLQPALGE